MSKDFNIHDLDSWIAGHDCATCPDDKADGCKLKDIVPVIKFLLQWEGVDEARRFITGALLGDSHRLVDCGEIRHVVQEHYLIRPEPKRRGGWDVGSVRFEGASLREIIVEESLVPEHAKDEFCGEMPFGRG